MDALIKMNCIPIINTNDAVAPPPGDDYDLKGVSLRQTPHMQWHSKTVARYMYYLYKSICIDFFMIVAIIHSHDAN